MKRIVIIISVVVLISVSGCEKWYTTAVRFEVECDPPGFQVSYVSGHGDLEEKVIKESSWNKEFAVDEKVKEVWLYATSDSRYNALNVITARIYVEGNLEDEDESKFLGIVRVSVEL
jgi:hypothetical protein